MCLLLDKKTHKEKRPFDKLFQSPWWWGNAAVPDVILSCRAVNVISCCCAFAQVSCSPPRSTFPSALPPLLSTLTSRLQSELYAHWIKTAPFFT